VRFFALGVSPLTAGKPMSDSANSASCCSTAAVKQVSRPSSAPLGLHTALFHPKSLTLILSPGQRQTSETFKTVLEGHSAIKRPLKAE
jgi:hypothetical protein